MQCPDGTKITNAIIEFVMQEEGGDVETLRKALYCQVNAMDKFLLHMWSDTFKPFIVVPICKHMKSHRVKTD